MYADGWADLTIAQLAASHNTDNPHHWGYSCLCIGRKFDTVIENEYPEIDRVTGSYLHVFSLLPPPEKFLSERLRDYDLAKNVPEKAIYAKNRLLALERNRKKYYAFGRVIQVQDKVTLLKDLQNAGLSVDQYADFLFFDFRTGNNGIEIDVIAAKSAPLGESSSIYNYIDLFTNMGTKAEYHYSKKHDVREFVKDLSMDWAIELVISKAFNLRKYIFEFLERARGL